MRKISIFLILCMLASMIPVASADGGVPVDLGYNCRIMYSTSSTIHIRCDSGADAYKAFAPGNLASVRRAARNYVAQNNGIQVKERDINVALNYYSKNRASLFLGKYKKVKIEVGIPKTGIIKL